MSRTFTRIAMAAATAGLLTLAACGDNGDQGGTRLNGQSDATVVADTLPAAATDTSVATDTSLATTDTEAPTTTASTSGSGSSATVVDPALEQAIAEAEALLGATDKDLADANKGAANGG
ncbi:MAG: hypothetical protein Q7V57_08075 [Actinomycetota bacterium]|nr:hypothetical protein [Actinomycetota bacterium]